MLFGRNTHVSIERILTNPKSSRLEVSALEFFFAKHPGVSAARILSSNS
jgi:hypothetical protein